MNKVVLINSRKHSKIGQTELGFSRLLRHLARKRSGSILSSPEPARGVCLI